MFSVRPGESVIFVFPRALLNNGVAKSMHLPPHIPEEEYIDFGMEICA